MFIIAEELARNAAKLKDESTVEACKRSAVSRFYYSAYILAKNFAEDRGFQPHRCPEERKLGSHEKLWEWWFGEVQPDTNENQELSSIGASLLGMRTLSDYRLHQFFAPNLPDRAKKHAEKIYELIAKLKKPDGGAGAPGSVQQNR